MSISIAYLGPSGTNTETAALAYRDWLRKTEDREYILSPYPSIALTLKALANREVDLAVVPVENSIQGSVAITLDSMWQLERLQIQKALVLPISHAILSYATSLDNITTVYSHPQALAQCQKWLEQNLSSAVQIATNSTTEALQYLEGDRLAAAISAPRASKIYNLPILAAQIQDYPDNCTCFWGLGLKPAIEGERMSVAFSISANVPGALVKPLSIFAERGINLSRIESRPTKRSLGEYIFYIDLEVNSNQELTQTALQELSLYTEVLKIFGSYNVLTISI
ncbi:MAG: prephenate dehydratase [Prochloraceae cyanobacterium]